MKEPDISIVVPVYNVEHFIERCLNSIISQSFKNWELLLVDDGSTDTSGKICDEYSKHDGRIKVIHITNHGRSAARNMGINCANGEWVVFIDADDNVDEHYLQVMFDARRVGENAVLISQGYKSVNDDGSICYSYPEVKYEDWVIKPPADSKIIETNSLFHIQAVWGRLFNTKIIKNNSISFEEKIHHSEDGVFLHKYLLHCKKCYFVSFQGYNYRVPLTNNTNYRVDYEEIYQLALCYESLVQELIKYFQITGRYYRQRLIDMYLSRLGTLLFDKDCPSLLRNRAKRLSRRLVFKRPILAFSDVRLLIKFIIA